MRNAEGTSEMAREYARIRISIADDEDIERLSVDAQWLYFRVLIPDPTLNSAGVADWRPNRLVGKAGDVTLDRIFAAAAELEQAHYALFDLDTEEVLVRSYMRSDEILRNPKAAVGVIRSYRSVASRTLRAAIVAEVVRERSQHPEYSTWTSKISGEGMDELVTRTAMRPGEYTNPITNLVSNQFGIHKPNQIGNENTKTDADDYQPEAQPDYQSNWEPHSLKPEALSPKPEAWRGYVSTEGHQSDSDENEPPSKCPTHIDDPNPPRCGACADARRQHDRWHTNHTAAARQTAINERDARVDAERAEIAGCSLCDDRGYVGARVCDHDPDAAERNAAGMARVRAALGKTGIDPPA